eukprot:TRINITY_DN4502_c0_g1_i1.p1 TRINITY_DN4502_c0_g1~~TRINITY_DN4502_c0_g1_i1.p1  ORF type:complete len:358 (-),score=76.24 TRINITY_DN4502_c0_g1_i1:413-1420(-)
MGVTGILGFKYGIMQAPLGPDISGPELVASVANAGGIGLLRSPDWDSPDTVRNLIYKTRALTQKPFGVGVVLHFPHKENIQAILEERVAILQVYSGDLSKELIDKAHEFGVKVIQQVGSIEQVEKAISLGVDGVVVQGTEAGGHVIGKEPLMTLLPKVAEIVKSHHIPVIAAGGIVDARGYVAALALGADGVSLGTRFVATTESNAHPFYKQKLVEACDTEYTDVFGRARWHAPHRVIKTDFFNRWKNLPSDVTELQQPIIGSTVIYGKKMEIPQFSGTVPNVSFTGDFEKIVLYAGQGVGLIDKILPAAKVIENLVEEAQKLIKEKLDIAVLSS